MKNNNLAILVIDIGGTHVKIKVTGHKEERKIASGPTMTPQMMVDGVKVLAKDWHYDVISIGCPTTISKHGKPLKEPANLGKGWVDFNYQAAFKCPVHLINDATMQALGDYDGGRMLFLGLGTGLGSTLIERGVIVPLELAHLPYKKGTFEDYLGLHALEKKGKKKWTKEVLKVIEIFQAALEPEKIMLGGGNARLLKTLPPACHLAANSNAFLGGFRLWEHFLDHFLSKLALGIQPTPAKEPAAPKKSISVKKKTPTKRKEPIA